MIIKIVCLFIFAVLFFSFFALYLNTHPPRYHLHETPEDYNLSATKFSVQTCDAVIISGVAIVPNTRCSVPAIIINHGLGAAKCDFYSLAAYFVEQGFAVLLFDYRGHGNSSGTTCTLGLHEQKDLSAIIDRASGMHGIDAEKIGLYGFSLGASVALLVAAADKRIHAVAADSPFATLEDMTAHVLRTRYYLPRFPFMSLIQLWYRLLYGSWMKTVSPLSIMKQLSGTPLLFVVGDSDTLIPPSHTKKLFESATGHRELWIVEGASHGTTMSVAGIQYYKKVATFFTDAFKYKKQ